MGGRNLSFAGAVGVLEGVLLADLLVEHLCVLRGRRRGSLLALIVGVLVGIWRRAVWRVVVVVCGSGCHVGRRCTGGRAIVAAWRCLLRRRIVVLMVHVVLLSRIGHLETKSTAEWERGFKVNVGLWRIGDSGGRPPSICSPILNSTGPATSRIEIGAVENLGCGWKKSPLMAEATNKRKGGGDGDRRSNKRQKKGKKYVTRKYVIAHK